MIYFYVSPRGEHRVIEGVEAEFGSLNIQIASEYRDAKPRLDVTEAHSARWSDFHDLLFGASSVISEATSPSCRIPNPEGASVADITDRMKTLAESYGIIDRDAVLMGDLSGVSLDDNRLVGGTQAIERVRWTAFPAPRTDQT